MSKLVSNENLLRFGQQFKSNLADVATSGSYVDLTDKPDLSGDWNQNDPNGPGYIKNRTHYEVINATYNGIHVNWTSTNGYEIRLGSSSGPSVEEQYMSGQDALGQYLEYWWDDPYTYAETLSSIAVRIYESQSEIHFVVNNQAIAAETFDKTALPLPYFNDIVIYDREIVPLDPKFVPSKADKIEFVFNSQDGASTDPVTVVIYPNEVVIIDYRFTSSLTIETSGSSNYWHFIIYTGNPAANITWPSVISNWAGGSAPTINDNSVYEISILNGIAICMEV